VIGGHQVIDQCVESAGSGHALFINSSLRACARCYLRTAPVLCRSIQKQACVRAWFRIKIRSIMETILDIGAVIIFLLVVPSVAWAVRTEAKEVPAILAAFVALFVAIMGVVFMSAASQLATSDDLSTQVILLIFLVVIAIFARTAWASKPAH
jgi:hypothetical protein